MKAMKTKMWVVHYGNELLHHEIGRFSSEKEARKFGYEYAQKNADRFRSIWTMYTNGEGWTVCDFGSWSEFLLIKEVEEFGP